MFKKKPKKNICPRCGKKASGKYLFCPHCGQRLQRYEKQPDSLLDQIDSPPKMSTGMPFPFNTLIKKMIKDMTKQMQESQKSNLNKDVKGPKRFVVDMPGMKGRIVINMGGKPINPMMKQPKPKDKPQPKTKMKIKDFNKEDSKIFSGLKKIEPKTSVRRLSDSILYVLNIPNVSKDKIIINHLGNSIEIKAISKKKGKTKDQKAYFKVIPVSNPIKNWNLEKDILTLELEI